MYNDDRPTTFDLLGGRTARGSVGVGILPWEVVAGRLLTKLPKKHSEVCFFGPVFDQMGAQNRC
jgi:hypothetical protein